MKNGGRGKQICLAWLTVCYVMLITVSEGRRAVPIQVADDRSGTLDDASPASREAAQIFAKVGSLSFWIAVPTSG